MRVRMAGFALALLTGCPAPARGDWAFAGFLGASFTQPNTIVLDRPAAGTSVSLAGVHYAGRSFEAPPYYGYRAARLGERVGVEGEFVHLKAYANAAGPVTARGGVDGRQIDGRVPLGDVLERFSMSHGLNLVLANVVWYPGGRRGAVAASVRGGAGVAVPHGESTVDGLEQEQYEVSSLAAQGAFAVELRARGRLRLLAEYKLTTAAPHVSVSGGTVSGRFVSQHLVFGVGWHTRS